MSISPKTRSTSILHLMDICLKYSGRMYATFELKLFFIYLLTYTTVVACNEFFQMPTYLHVFTFYSKKNIKKLALRSKMKT